MSRFMFLKPAPKQPGTRSGDREQTDPAALPVADTALNPSDKEHARPLKKKRTFGNKVYDMIVWPVFQVFGVWSLSLAIAADATSSTQKHIKHDEHGNVKPQAKIKWLSNLVQEMENSLIRTFTKINDWKPFGRNVGKTLLRGSSPKVWAEDSALFAILSVGGTFMALPTYELARHDQEAADKINHVFHKTPQEPELVKPEPPQSMGSILAGRMASLGVAFSIFLVAGAGQLRDCNKFITEKAVSAYQKLRPTASAEHIQSVRNFSKIAVFDLAFTSATAAIGYVVNRKRSIRKMEKELETKNHETSALANSGSPDNNIIATLPSRETPYGSAVLPASPYTTRICGPNRPANFTARADSRQMDSGAALV